MSIRSSFPKSPAPALPIDELEKLAKAAWRERGIIILWPDRINNEWDRRHALNLAEQTYGKRPNRG